MRNDHAALRVSKMDVSIAFYTRALYASPETPVNGLISWGYAWHDFIYPNQHEIRDDLGHSIRGKDAEHVFHRWTTIFE